MNFKPFGLALVAGGYAVGYFTIYAMQNIAAVKLIDNVVLDSCLLLAMATGCMLHSLYRRSETVALLSALLAFVTLSLSPVTSFTVVASALMAVGLLARVPIWTERWLFGVRCAGLEAGRWRSMGALASSMAVNTITPTARVAGGLVRARFLAADVRRGFGVAYGTVLVDQLVHHAAMGVLSFVALAAAVGERAPRWSVVGAGGLVAALALAAALWGRWRTRGGAPEVVDRLLAGTRRRLEKQAARSPRLGAALAGGGDALAIVGRLLRDPAVLLSAALLGAVLFLVNGLVQWLAFRALDLPVGLLPALAVVDPAEWRSGATTKANTTRV